MQLTEHLADADLRLRGHLSLILEEQDLKLEQSFANRFVRFNVQAFREVDSSDLRTERWCEGLDCDPLLMSCAHELPITE